MWHSQSSPNPPPQVISSYSPTLGCGQTLASPFTGLEVWQLWKGRGCVLPMLCPSFPVSVDQVHAGWLLLCPGALRSPEARGVTQGLGESFSYGSHRFFHTGFKPCTSCCHLVSLLEITMIPDKHIFIFFRTVPEMSRGSCSLTSIVNCKLSG